MIRSIDCSGNAIIVQTDNGTGDSSNLAQYRAMKQALQWARTWLPLVQLGGAFAGKTLNLSTDPQLVAPGQYNILFEVAAA